MKTRDPTHHRPFKKPAIVLFVVTGLLVLIGAVLYLSTERDALAAASVAWLPAGLSLLTALSLYWWDGKDDGSSGGVGGPL